MGTCDAPGGQSICVLRGTSSNVLDVSPRGRNGRQADGSSTQPQAGRSHELIPLPEREPEPPRRPRRPSWSRRPRVLEWAPRRDPSAIQSGRQRADHGFDAQARTRVSLNSCLTARESDTDTSPDDELDERGVGARPNLENSTACQKSMPSNTSSHRHRVGHQVAPGSDVRKNPLVDNEQQRELVVRAQPVKQPSTGNDLSVRR